jgi:predicted phage terminase large subunit-like protein
MSGAALPSLEALRLERARRSLAWFIREGWHVLEPSTRLQWSWHHDALALHLQGLTEDWLARSRNPAAPMRAQNLLANVPPGSMKSRVVSVYWPAWVWLKAPEWKSIFLSANPRVALRDSVLCRDVLESEWYRQGFRPEWELAADQNSKSLFKNTLGGFRMATGFSSRITGSRADALVVDDPHDASEAASKVARESVVERWRSAVSNRVNSLEDSVRVCIMQRLHEEDLSGAMLADGGWEHLCIPQEWEAPRACKCPTCSSGVTAYGWSDPRTEPGELLQPERFTRRVLDAERKRLGSYGYAGQHQQRPAPDDGGMFPRRWWRWHALGGVRPVTAGGAQVSRPKGCTDLPPVPTPVKWDAVIISLDANFKEGEDSDPACAVVVGKVGAARYVLHLAKCHGLPATLRMMRELVKAYPAARARLVEARANGDAVVSMLRKEVSGLIPVEPEGGKDSRAAAFQPSVEAGDWHLPDGAEWVQDYVEEFSTFPAGAHDDAVDATSQAAAYLDTPSIIIR